MSGVLSKIEIERNIQGEKAIRSLARYKFVMFGYHAGQWVLLNRLSGNEQANPFRGFVQLARAILREMA
jgi:hypothetical protein